MVNGSIHLPIWRHVQPLWFLQWYKHLLLLFLHFWHCHDLQACWLLLLILRLFIFGLFSHLSSKFALLKFLASISSSNVSTLMISILMWLLDSVVAVILLDVSWQWSWQIWFLVSDKVVMNSLLQYIWTVHVWSTFYLCMMGNVVQCMHSRKNTLCSDNISYVSLHWIWHYSHRNLWDIFGTWIGWCFQYLSSLMVLPF